MRLELCDQVLDLAVGVALDRLVPDELVQERERDLDLEPVLKPFDCAKHKKRPESFHSGVARHHPPPSNQSCMVDGVVIPPSGLFQRHLERAYGTFLTQSRKVMSLQVILKPSCADTRFCRSALRSLLRGRTRSLPVGRLADSQEGRERGG